MNRSNYYTFSGLILTLMLALGSAAAAPAIIEQCTSCHDVDGSGVGKDFVPIISGTPAVAIEEALYAYQDGARQCKKVPEMCETAAKLTDENIADVAEYYGSLPRYSHAATFDEKLVVKGKAIHERLCSRCHVPPDDPDVGDVLGIPLHGQRADYLQYALEAYLDGTRENLLSDMEEKVLQLQEGDVKALVNYYISY